MRKKWDTLLESGSQKKGKGLLGFGKTKSKGEVELEETVKKIKKKQKDKAEKFKEKEKTVKEEITEKKKIWNQFKGIRMKLLSAFLIPVVLMAVFGIVAYKKSSNAIIKNYESSTTDTLNAVSQYLELGFNSVADKAVELSLSDKVEDYYRRAYEKDTLDDLSTFRKLQEDSIVIKETNDFIKAIHMMAKVGNCLSTSKTPSRDFYQNYMNSEDAKKISESSARNIWIGYHNNIDEQLGINKSDYVAAIVNKLSFSDGYIIIDISAEEVMKVLKDISNSSGSIIGFITGDGRETLTNPDLKDVFTGSQFYKDAMKGKSGSGLSYQTYKDEKYLYVYSKVGGTGAMVCALIPKGEIIRQAKSIRDLCIIFVAAACFIALLIGTLIAGGIGNAISKLVKSISIAAKGDLTAKFDTKRKDEFHVLSNGLKDMTAGMSNLIGEVAGVGNKVTESAGVLSETSDKILEATKGISFTIDEIEKGVVQQASDTEHCLGQMSNLSDKINQVYSNTYEIEKIANNTKGIVGDGLVIIEELNNKSKETTDVTQLVIQDIEALVEQSHNIGNFVGIINEIASQTNLLSLNASIEAARAGDAGRGFAVVADEIRKLADQSVQAASQIQGIVTDIQSKTQGTVISAKQAENIVESQTEALNKTIRVFEDINNHVGNLVNNLDNISNGVKGIETAKEVTMDAIRNISAVAQQTAAASEEVSATANNQISSVENLAMSAQELAMDAKNLEKAIQSFKIS